MKIGRALLILLAVAAAAYLAFNGMRAAPKPGAGPSATPTPTPDDGAPAPNPLAPFGDPTETNAPQPTTAPPNPPAPVPDVDKTLVGTPVVGATEVSLVVPYKTGTKSRYRVTEAELDKERDSGVAHVWQFTWNVSTEVTQGDGSGAARVKFQIDSFRFQTQALGRPIDIDSEHVDRPLLDDKQYMLGRTVKPWLAIRKMPVEFVIDAAGVVRDIDGLDAMNRKFLDAVALFGAQMEQDAIDAPTKESMIERWGAYLFPALGGGKMKASEERKTSQFRTNVADRWALVAVGSFHPTHDDPDAFRVAFVGKPTIEDLNRPATHPSAMNAEGARVFADWNAWQSAWRFDRAHGRLLASALRAKYLQVVGYRAGVNAMQQPEYEHPYVDMERSVDVELVE